MATVIDGKALALEIRQKVADEVALLKSQGLVPGLATVLVGSDPASGVYVKNKRTACATAGIANFDHDLPADTAEKELLELVAKLNVDKAVHGILVQLPLPRHINERKILEAINPLKDVDCFHPCNVGRLSNGEPYLIPCTPEGIMELIDSTGIDISGKKAVVVGRSNIVGKPTALLLLAQDATVTICHSKTSDLQGEIATADILVVAIEKPKFIPGAWIKPGAVVIDVGINRTAEGKLVGDVDFGEAEKRAGAITPVPGGVGPMTIAMLIKNTLAAAKGQFS